MKIIFITFLAVILFLGCAKQKEERKEDYTFILDISDIHDPTWEELSDILEIAAEQGHCRLLINGTFIYLPPVKPYGQGKKQASAEPKSLTLHGIQDHGGNHNRCARDWEEGNMKMNLCRVMSHLPILAR